jgi:hypothetical protein
MGAARAGHGMCELAITIPSSSELLTLPAYQRPAVKLIPSARKRKCHAVCLLSKHIPTRPMRSSVRVPFARATTGIGNALFKTSN